MAAIKALAKVFSHLVHKHYSWIVSPSGRGAEGAVNITEKTGDVTEQYRDWMRQNYIVFLERLQELLHYENNQIQVMEFSRENIAM